MGVETFHVYTDGASRGNPGQGAVAYSIYDNSWKLIKEDKKIIGLCTNYEAEYNALAFALESASKIIKGKLECYSDNENVVKQMRGENKIKAKNLIPLYGKVKELEKKFESVTYNHRPRGDANISKVDKLANLALNQKFR